MILEQLDARGRVTHRFRLDGTETTIGRAYDNHVILDDPYADPHHLKIAPGLDGRLEFADLDTINGTWDPIHRARMAGGLVRPGLELRVGRTVLRFSGLDQPVAAAVPDPALLGGPEHHLLEPRIAALLVVIAIVAMGVDAYFASTEDFTLIDFLTPGVSGLLVAAVWAGGWAFANRLVTHRFRFLPHLGWAALIGVAFLGVRIGTEWLEFFLPGAGSAWIGLAVDLVLLTALVAGHLWLVTEWEAARRWRAAAAVTFTLAAVGLVLERDQLADPDGSLGGDVLKPLSGRLVPARTADDFFRRARTLKAEVDELDAEE
jgi:hypothetical protein